MINPALLGQTDWINAEALGAIGNGSEDSTIAFQSAINLAINEGGGVVYIPAGTYNISSALTLGSNVRIIGAGRNVTTINQTSTTADGFQFAGQNAQNIQIENLTIKGPGSGSGVGISLVASGGSNPNVMGCHFKDLMVCWFGSHGFYAELLIVSQFDNVTSQSNGGNGFGLGGATSTSLTFNSCFANSNSGNGFNLVNSTYSTLNSCASDSNAGYYIGTCVGITLNSCGNESAAIGFKIAGGTGIVLSACKTYANSMVSFWATSSAADVTFIGCCEQSPNSATHSFQFDAGTSVNVIGWNYTTAPLQTATANSLNDGSGDIQSAAGLYVNGSTNMYGAQILGSQASKTSAYTLGAADRIVFANPTGGAFTLTLPSASGEFGQVYTIKNNSASTNTITIATTSSQKIDNASTATITTAYGKLTVVSDGSNWWSI